MERRIERKVSIVLLLSFIFTAFFTSFNRNILASESTFKIDIVDLNKDDTIEIGNLPKEIKESDFISVPDGLEIKVIGAGTIELKAKEDLVNIELWYKVEKGKIEQELESGEGNNLGEVGDGEGGIIDWGSFDLGKHGWDNSEGYDREYAIRIDASKFQDYDSIYLIDKSVNLTEVENLTVSRLQPNANNKVDNRGPAEYELLESDKGYFAIKINIDKLEDGEMLRYDVNYFMNKINKEKSISNKYKIVSFEEYKKIVADITGNSNEDNSTPEKTPEKPVEETPEKPVEETPEKPVEETPETPVEETPEKPVEETPETPVEETPEKPVEETPETPVEETPEKPVEETPEEPEIPEEDEIEDVEPEKPDMPIIEEDPEDPKEDEIEDVEPEKPEAPIIEEEPENSEEDKIEDKEPNKPELPVVEETPEEEPEEEIEDEVEDIESERKKPSVKEATKENEVEKLPATGSKSHVGTYILGLSMILLGLVLRRKNK